MANWAYTNYVIEGPAETLQKIYEAIQHHDIEEGSSDHWEGNVLNTLGIEWERQKLDGSGYYMRGFIQYDTVNLDIERSILSFDAEEAWGATDFNEALEKGLPDVKVFYEVIEEGGDVYFTNDKEGKYFSERYYVDTCIKGNFESDYFETEEQVLNWLADLTNGEVNTMKDVDEFNKRAERQCNEDENFINIHEFKTEE